VTKFRNGDKIPQAKSAYEFNKYGKEGKAAWCYVNYDKANGTKYGKLYNWYAVNDPRGLAPIGYHIPSNDEWSTLIDFLGGRNEAGVKLKTTEGWFNSGNGTNSSGFSAVPISTSVSIFWSSTEKDEMDVNVEFTEAWYYKLQYSDGFIDKYTSPKTEGCSVRCIKD
jgi:uncharacterized protein (TIGR02145 family)